MSLRYKGAVISATPPTTTGGNSGTAPGAWTLQQQLQAQAAGTWPSFVPVYIEDVFSTWLYTGNGSTQTITNGIDLAGKGGLVWVKSRDVASGHFLYDTSRGVNQYLASNTTAASANYNSSLTAFNSNGFTLGFNLGNVDEKYASWTFRKQPKFFDVVTYTGNGSTQNIAHALGSVPGMMIVKAVSTTGNWPVYHRSLGATQKVWVNVTNAASAAAQWNNTEPTSTQFTVGTDSDVNSNGVSYVAYLFAHNAGGFGLTGTDNVISCGSFTQPSSGNATITLGYEPQWVLIKRTDAVSNWFMYDIMRGMSLTDDAELVANTSGAEGLLGGGYIYPTSTGFVSVNGSLSAGTYIYIAIRRGPMKTPTSGTSVFAPQATRDASNGTATQNAFTSNFPVDLFMQGYRAGSGANAAVRDRLRGTDPYVITSSTNAEASAAFFKFDDMTGIYTAASQPSNTDVNAWMFRRAPGFMDEVCYSGTGSATTVSHNLGVAPELMIVKKRSSTSSVGWFVYCKYIDQPNQALYWLGLNLTNAADAYGAAWNSTNPTSSVFTVGTDTDVNASGATYVAYLFASCPGVSKVGTYTGTGATQTISCGFAARFVLIKRTDSTGDWFVWDTARGMVAGTDPRLALNSTAAEVNANWVYTDASGFQIVTTNATVNASGGSYIYLAIA